MNRLLSALRWEVLVQFRQNIFYAALFVMVLWSAVLYQIPDAGIVTVLVSILFLDLSIFGFFFMAALYYLEKGDRVLEGLVVTPLRVVEYLTAKIGVLTALSVVVGAVVTLIVYGFSINWGWYMLAVVGMSVPISLLGFVLAARYNGINEFLVPGILFLVVMQFPLLGYLSIWDNFLLYLIPSQPGMILLEAAFTGAPLWEIGYALLYLAALIFVGWRWAEQTFVRVIARQVGN
ncbi:MAG: ABC transporter permease [Caldilineaceae bacterium]|nr:ABC transporter permease [Caldilineaceae bacterium]